MANRIDLTSVFVTSGVNEQGQPFVTVAAHGHDGVILMGQLTPDRVRTMALNFLATAEAAEQEAAMLRVVRHLELPDQLAGAVIIELRNTRPNDADPGLDTEPG